MSAPIPPVRITFSVDDANVAAALQQVQVALRRVQTEAQKTTGTTAAIASGTDRMAAGFRRASQDLTAATVGAAKWTAGLRTLENQQVQTAQATARLNAAVHPVAAQMAQSATGTAVFAQGLRNLNAQGLGFRKGIPGLENTNQSLKGIGASAGLAAVGLRTLAPAYIGFKTGQLVKGAVQDAAALNDLSQATGASVETLSILRVGAERSNLTLEDLSQTFRGLSRSLDQLNSGNGEAVEAFAEIGLSAKDLIGLSVDDAFLKIANSLAALPDGFDKAAIASRLFGRSGAELIPLLNELAGDGFDNLTRSARAMNAVVSKETAKAADELGDRFADLGGTLKGLVLTMVGPLIPGLTRLAEGLALVASTAAAGIESLSRLPGLLRALPFGIGSLAPGPGAEAPPSFSGVAAGGSTTATGQSGLQRASQAEIAALAELREAGRTTEAQQRRIREVVRQLEADYAKAADDVVRQAQILKQIESLTKRIKADTGDAAANRRAELEALRQQADATVRTFSAIQTSLQGADQENQTDFDAGIVGLREFFARRGEILSASADAEIAQLEARRSELLAAIALPAVDGQGVAERRAEVARLNGEVANLSGQIDAARERGQQAQAANDTQAAQAAANLVAARLGFELQIQQAKGQTLAVALVSIDQEVQAFDRILAQQEVDADLRRERTEALREALTLQAQAGDLNRQVEGEFGALSRERQAIEDRLLTGKLTERQATEQIAALERDRLPALRAMADAMAQLADETGNPELQAQAQQLTADLNSLAAGADLAAQRAAAFRESLADAVQSDVTQFLGSTITQVETLEEAFLSLGRSIAQTFQQAFAEKLVGDIRRAIEGIGTIEIPAAPSGLTADLLAQQAAVAPDLAQEAFGSTQQAAVTAQQQVAAAQLTAAGATLTAAGGTLTAGGGTLNGAAAALTGSTAAVTGSAAALVGAAGALSAAAAALVASAASSTGGDLISGASDAAFATGGPVSGPAGIDKVRGWLTHREFVQPVPSVDYYGGDFMEAIRRRAIPRDLARTLIGGRRYHLHVPKSPRFATGGLVAPIRTSDGLTGTITIDTPEGTNARAETDDDRLRFIVKNRRTIRRTLDG